MNYDPFGRGPRRVDVRTIEAHDAARDRVFPIEVWSSGDESAFIVFSHAAAQGRRSAAYLGDHLASHGYTVAAIDHSELVAATLARRDNEKEREKLRRWQDIIDSVPDVRFLLDRMHPASARIGIVGHSLGGWTALAAAESEPRVRSVVARAPAGASNPRPGILPATLTYARHHDVPLLLLAAENDTSLPLAGMHEIFGRTPPPKLMAILRRADHGHFLENVEQLHERFRTMPASGDLAAIQKEMRPIAELHSGEQAHRFVCGLTLAHFDATLREREDAHRFLESDLERRLGAEGIEAIVVRA